MGATKPLKLFPYLLFMPTYAASGLSGRQQELLGIDGKITTLDLLSGGTSYTASFQRNMLVKYLERGVERGEVDGDIEALREFPDVPDHSRFNRKLSFKLKVDDDTWIFLKVVPSSAGDPEWPWAVALDKMDFCPYETSGSDGWVPYSETTIREIPTFWQ
jgi:hypothetical protein